MNQNKNISKLIGVVIVSYKTTVKTIDYIKHELNKIQTPTKIVVVNNSYLLSDNDIFLNSLDVCFIKDNEVPNKEKKIFIINSMENLGFAKGNNLGAKFLIHHFQPEYILFSNNDIEIISEEVIEKLVAKAASDPNIGIIGPKMVNSNGEKVSPRYDRVSPLRYALWHIFFPIRNSHILSILNIKTPGLKELRMRNQGEGFCYWIAGSFMIIKTDVFIKIDGFDPYTFLYSEEKILAERLRIHGYGMYYFPEVSVLSIGEYTTSLYLHDTDKKKLMFESDLYYYKKYFKINILLLGLLKLSYFLHFAFYDPFYRFIDHR